MALQDLTPQLRTRLSRMERTVGWFVFLATALLLADRMIDLDTAKLSDAQADLTATTLMCKLDKKSVKAWMTTK